MPPLTPTIITRLAPGLPLLWRDERTLQFGLDGDVRIDVDNEWAEPLLARMSRGFRRASYDVMAHALGAPRAQARDLLGRVEGLLVDESPALPAAWVESIALSDGRCEYRMRESLADEGVPHGIRSRAQDIGVILVPGAAAALQFAPSHHRTSRSGRWSCPDSPRACRAETRTSATATAPGRACTRR